MSFHAEEYARLRDRYIQCDPKIMGGVPVIRGTRVPVRTIAALIEDGECTTSCARTTRTFPRRPTRSPSCGLARTRVVANRDAPPLPRPRGCARRTIGYRPAMTSTEVIEEIGARLARAAPPKSRVLLFGSHARGTADDGSDFDVLVIEPTVESPISEAVRLRRELRGLGVPIDVVVMDEAKAKRRAGVRGTMVERALREGRLLAQT
jgi:predicted nucleotidyltransferase